MPLSNSIDFYKKLYDQLPVAVFVADIKTGKIVEANNKACELVNRPYDEVISLNQSQLHPAIDESTIRNDFKSHIEALMNNKDVEPIEHLVVDSENNIIPVEISPSLITIENDTYIIGLFKDLRSRKERENILSYYDKALEKSMNFLALVDRDYRYKSVNEYYTKVFKRPKEEIIGLTLKDLLGEEYFNDVVKERFDRALLGESIEFEKEVDIAGKLLYLQVHYEPYHSIDNKIIGVVVNVYDLSRFKAYEEESIQKEKLLIQQSKMAAMGEMLENIAHQWRQPLSVISTCTSGILLQKEFKTLDDDILEDSLKNIMNTTTYLSNTIDDFKNFFERDKQRIEFDLAKTTDKTLDLVEMSFKNNDIEIKRDYDKSILVYNYKNEFMQVLLNIINNAKDAILSKFESGDDKKIICISIYSSNDQIVIDIQDNAGGVPEDIKDKIFEPYFTTKHQSQGTGIGLFMTQEIVTKHMEGELEVMNKSFEVEDISYYGALFRIII
ncbi:PAS sensor-containing two-component system histidine kinase [Poseidonibacter lekithochrous]|nr:PAS sensor-containing two-component system histidine kinase [Poseidonibacter lekithochrous]